MGIAQYRVGAEVYEVTSSQSKSLMAQIAVIVKTGIPAPLKAAVRARLGALNAEFNAKDDDWVWAALAPHLVSADITEDEFQQIRAAFGQPLGDG